MARRAPNGEHVSLLFENGRSLSLGWVTNRGADLINLLRQWADREEQHLAPDDGDAPPPPEPERDEDR